MGKVKQLLDSYKQSSDPNTKSFVDNVLQKLLYDNGSIESDLRALIRKSALLQTEGAKSHSLTKNPREYKSKMREIIDQLSQLNLFIEYIVKNMPESLQIINQTIIKNKIYIGMHLNH